MTPATTFLTLQASLTTQFFSLRMDASPLHTAELLDLAADRWKDRAYLIDGQMTLTFGDTRQLVRNMSASLLKLGVSAGDRVAIWAPNCWQWVIGALATHYIGATLVTLNTRYRGHEAAQILKLSGASTLITISEFLGTCFPALLAEEDCGALRNTIVINGDGPSAFDAILSAGRTALESADQNAEQAVSLARHAVSSHDISDVLFTSGTTGTPKGVMTRHDQNLRAFSSFTEILGLDERDRYLIINPFFHSFGYKAGWLSCLLVGAEAHPMAVFDAERVIELIRDRQITCMPGPPTLFHTLINHPGLHADDIESLTKVTTGAAVIPTELVESMWRDLGIDTVITAYGLSESCGLVSMCRRGDDASTIAHTSGRAIPDVDIAIMNTEGEVLTAGETGEIVVRGFNVMQGYLDEPAATQQAIDSEGWLHTGDVGRLDEAGNLTITDRLKDMYISGGFNCYPAEIEQLLTRHPAISQAAVVGVPDDRLGEVGAAFLIASDAHRPDDQSLRDWCRQEMANYKIPRRFSWLDELPLNASGKVLKTTLRGML